MNNWQRVSERRTQLYLPDDIYKAVKEKGRKQGVSMAEIIRRSIEDSIPALKNKKKVDDKDKDKAWKELMKLSGMIKKGPKDMSYNISKYISKMYKQRYK